MLDRFLKRALMVAVIAALAVGIIGAKPSAITAATNYFDTTKIVTRDITWGEYVQDDFDYVTAWCPAGYRVTGGSLGKQVDNWSVNEDRPVIWNGRHGWRIDAGPGWVDSSWPDSHVMGTVYAICTR